VYVVLSLRGWLVHKELLLGQRPVEYALWVGVHVSILLFPCQLQLVLAAPFKAGLRFLPLLSVLQEMCIQECGDWSVALVACVLAGCCCTEVIMCCGVLLQVARTIITEGCERCATNEDVWLEAARLQPPEMAKAVLARGVANIPTSYKLWMAAARLEVDDAAKQRVLRRALERIPGSVR